MGLCLKAVQHPRTTCPAVREHQDLPEDFVREHAGWFVPMVFRDAHQTETKLLNVPDILDAVRDELCGEDWTVDGSFRSGTSIGCDSAPPNAVSLLSPPLRESIAIFLNKAEAEGAWLEEVATSLVHPIPKESGGRMPIGVLPTVVRI